MLDDTSLAFIAAVERGDEAEADRLAAVLDAATELERQLRESVKLGDAALDYAARGVAVFPLKPRGKTPLTGHGFKDATTDPGQVRAWWEAAPDANVGVPTGLTFDVVDIDGADGIAAMYNGTDPLVDTLTVLGVALTSRDGGRHLYVPVSGHGNKARIWPGIDYRGTGGYVVAPPSVGPNGRRYTWACPLKAGVAA